MAEPVKEAARTFWAVRERRDLQEVRVGNRYGELVTAVVDSLTTRGIDPAWIRIGRAAEFPGSYGLGRAAWDLAIFRDDIPLAAVTIKTLGGPSYGNNFNNRIQELTGNAFAVRQHDGQSIERFRPYLGLFFIIQEGEGANRPLQRPRGSSTDTIWGLSYKERLGETFAQFRSDGLYDGIAYVSASKDENPSLEEPRPDMSVNGFVDALATRILSYVAALSAGTSTPASIHTPYALSEVSSDNLNRYKEVLRNAHGDRAAYALDRLPMGEGGQAQVFRAVHKSSQTEVAFKRRRSKRDLAVSRMQREIEISRLLSTHPHAMPVLDAEPDGAWFVMPMADATAEDHHEQLRDPEQLRDLVNAMASVLSEAHKRDWVHRDIKPSNILRLQGRWVLADWGIGRRPRGQTTMPGRTGRYIGTEGFAAPELSMDPHETTTHASDIYSLGRVIAWALTGQAPQANVLLLPPAGPWRSIVRAATQPDPALRPQSIEELLTLIAREFSVPQGPPVEQAAPLLTAACTGDSTSIDALLVLISDYPDDYDLYLDVLTRLPPGLAAPPLSRNPQLANALMHAFAGHVGGVGTRLVQFGEAARAVSWLHAVSAYAAERSEWDLLDEAVRTMCWWDESWNQWDPQDVVRPWLRLLDGDAASIMASAFRDHPGSARHFAALADEQAVDLGIRQAVRTAVEGPR
ncbi:protein kinase [Streptomyces sp. SID8350]|uniref:protein kinase domain-containing protein n=1 Tax=Streptomyces sp. AmelKG-D3 TaxID=1115568 RepID=UPI000823B219|nr:MULTISPECIES: PaeR7I family type II restriction endonuclease [unclassified Streptomyces]MYU01453.1 protein kinase [Streptomyces sp. SID8350]SCK63557.1 serine/threonine protein kinase [Streptomyces sp. AmelKG-D3]